MMGRRLRDVIPQLPATLDNIPDYAQVQEKERRYREKYKLNYDRRYGVTNLPPLNAGESVWV